MQTILIVLLCSAFLNFLPTIDSRFLLLKIKASKHGSELSGRITKSKDLAMEFLGYTMSKSKKCNETDIIDDSTASHSLNDVRLTCDDDPRCVFIYLPKCSVSMHENTGGMITCKGRPVHETMVESNGTSCIWEKRPPCPAGEIRIKGECKCGTGDSCVGNNRGPICDPNRSQCICSNEVQACKHGEYCKDGVCSANGHWEEWGEFSKCLPSCGSGYKNRTRKCIGHKGNGMWCHGKPESERVSCKKDPICNDLYSHAHENTLCKDSRDIKGRGGCKTDLDCLKNAKRSCDEDFECHGIAWHSWLHEQDLKLCLSRGSKTNHGWRTMWREDVRQDCTWDDWSAWSDCKSKCAHGNSHEECTDCRKTRSRNKRPEKFGGKPCEGSADETRDCTSDEWCNARNHCKWFGTSVFCEGECLGEYWFVRRDARGDGLLCWTGWKHYCCKTEWG